MTIRIPLLTRRWTAAGAGLGIGLLCASLALAQVEPPEPPGGSEANETEQNRSEAQPDRDNTTPSATDRDRTDNQDRSSSGDTTQRQREGQDDPTSRDPSDRSDRDRSDRDRSALDDPDRFREATRDTDPDQRSSTRRQDEFDRGPSSQRDSDFRRDDQFRRDDERFSRDDQFRRDDERFSRDDQYRRDEQFSRGSREFRSDRDTFESRDRFDVSSVRSADIGLWFDRSTADGLVINDIGTGAISRLGFREGDRIYSVNGMRVDSEAVFVRTLLDPRLRDQRVAVIIYRFGRPWTVYVQPSVLVQEYTTVAYDPLDDWGLVLDDRYDDYVVVWRVLPRSPAYYAGLRPGDVIVNWQGRRLTGRDDFVRLAGQGRLSDVALDITRNRQTRRVDLDLSGIQSRLGSRTTLRPDFDSGAGMSSGATIRSGTSGVRSGTFIDPNTGVRTTTEVDGNLRTGSRFESTIDGRLEGTPDGRLDRTDNRTLFPSNAPSGVPTPQTGVRGTIEVPGATGGVRVQGDTRRGIFGGRRP